MSKPVNILWIFADQLRWHALSCCGETNIQTPNIDRLARQGVNCIRAYSHSPMCVPFRGGLVTGQYGTTSGVLLHGDMLPTDRKTAAHCFRQAGYRTSWVGKWHLCAAQNAGGWMPQNDYWVHPYARGGFEDWFGFECSNDYWNTLYSTGETNWPPQKCSGFQTDALTDISLSYLQKQIKNPAPWFHCLSVEAPHSSHEVNGVPTNPAPEQFLKQINSDKLKLRKNVPESYQNQARSQQTGYYAQILNFDYNVGRLLDFLEDNKLSEHTLIMLFSDHGEMGGSHGLFHKTCVYDESVHIPLIMRLPGKLPAGSVCEELMSGLDIFPTATGLCQIPKPAGLHGEDLSLAVRSLALPARTHILVHWFGRRYPNNDAQYRGIITPQYTYAISERETECVLFDNKSDPEQNNNLFGKAESSTIKNMLNPVLLNAVLRSGEAVPAFLEQAMKN